MKTVNKKLGRPATGHDPAVTTRLAPETLADVDKWAGQLKITRAEAIRRLIERALQPTKKGKLNSHMDPTRTTALGMARFAAQFYAAAIAADDVVGLDKGYEAHAPPPVSYMVGHAIELALKAYLLHQGAPLKAIRRLGHNLETAFAKAEAKGLGSIMTVSAQDRSVLKILNALYSDKQLEYSVTGFKTFPVFGPMQTLAYRLINSVLDEIPDGHLLRRGSIGKALTGLVL